MKDWRGTEINIGDAVVYGSVAGSCSYPVEARVIEVVPPKLGAPKHRAVGQDRVKLRVRDCSFGPRTDNPVYVLADRVTVVRLP